MMRSVIMLLLFVSILSVPLADAAYLVNNGNGTVTDNRTGLTWQQGEPGAMAWGDALSHCEGLSLGGRSDWRLPNVNELESLTDDSRYSPAIDTSFFPDANASYYWSSTTGVPFPNVVWVVGFDNGYVGSSGSKYYGSYVRCVRGGQSGSLGSFDHFVVSAPASVTAGTAFNFTVTALDQFNNTATGDSGTVHFTSSDAAAVLPADVMLTSGTGTFQATLKNMGYQTITATDTVTASITGTSSIDVINLPTDSGDINTDGTVTIADALMALKIAVKLIPFDGKYLADGDVAPFVNGAPQPDGKIDISDALVILRKCVGLIDW